MNKSKIIFLTISLISISCFSQPNLDLDKFELAKQQSDDDKRRDVAANGCYMECDFDPYFGESFQSIMSECFKSIDSPELKTFTTVLALNNSGRVDQSWLNLGTNLSQCALQAITSMEYPKPPFEPYYARVTVNVE